MWVVLQQNDTSRTSDDTTNSVSWLPFTLSFNWKRRGPTLEGKEKRGRKKGDSIFLTQFSAWDRIDDCSLFNGSYSSHSSSFLNCSDSVDWWNLLSLSSLPSPATWVPSLILRRPTRPSPVSWPISCELLLNSIHLNRRRLSIFDDDWLVVSLLSLFVLPTLLLGWVVFPLPSQRPLPLQSKESSFWSRTKMKWCRYPFHRARQEEVWAKGANRVVSEGQIFTFWKKLPKLLALFSSFLWDYISWPDHSFYWFSIQSSPYSFLSITASKVVSLPHTRVLVTVSLVPTNKKVSSPYGEVTLLTLSGEWLYCRIRRGGAHWDKW